MKNISKFLRTQSIKLCALTMVLVFALLACSSPDDIIDDNPGGHETGPVAVTGVKLQETLTLPVEDSFTLSPQIEPGNATNKAVSWKSSNTAIATVDETGKVTAKAVGAATITVTTAEGGFTAQCQLTVEQAPDSIEITSPPNKTLYQIGENLDLTGLVVTGKYSGQSDKILTINMSHISGYNRNTTGHQDVTVTYGGKTADFSVEVRAGALVSIEVKHPNKIIYFLDEAFDKTGMTVKAHYSNDDEENVDIDEVTISGFNSSNKGAKTITVTWNGKSDTFGIVVISSSDTLDALVITKDATKTSYFQGEELSLAGLEITATYGSDSFVLDNSMFVKSGYDLNTTTTPQTVYLSFGGRSVNYSVTVTALTVDNLSIQTQPAKTTYFLGEDLNLTGIVVRAISSDGSNAEVTATPGSFDNASTGTKTVVLTYTNQFGSSKTVDLTVTVTALTISFNRNGGTTDASPTTRSVTSLNSTVTLPTAPTRTGYNFLGWNTAANGSGSAFTGSTQVNSTLAATHVNGTITVYAQWERIKVTFNPNGGNWSGSTTNQVIDVNDNGRVTAPANPTGALLTQGLYSGINIADTYQFEGWSNDGGTTILNLTTHVFNSNTTLTAKYTVITPISLAAGTNIITRALTYVNTVANAGEYTLLISESAISLAGGNNLTNANTTLKLRGLTACNITLNNSSYMFRINNATAKLILDNNITLTGRNNTDSLVRVENGELIMNTGSTITGNNIWTSANATYARGGGVFVAAGTTFTMNGGTISGNTVGSGGSAYNPEGGGVYSAGTFTMNNGTISGNTVSSSASYGSSTGGGVYNNGGTFTMNNGTISGNTLTASSTSGGGVYSYGSFTMNGGIISGNTVLSRGGGVMIAYNSFVKTGGIIYGNDVADTALKNTASEGSAVYFYNDPWQNSRFRNTTAGAGVNMTTSDLTAAGGWEN